jgi:cell division protein FtsX
MDRWLPSSRYGVASRIKNTFRNTGMVMSFVLSLTAVTGVIPAYIVYQLFSRTLAPNFAAAYLSGQSFALELSAILLILATLFSLVRGKETRHIISIPKV